MNRFFLLSSDEIERLKEIGYALTVSDVSWQKPEVADVTVQLPRDDYNLNSTAYTVESASA